MVTTNNLRTDISRAGWYGPEDSQYLASDGLRWRVVNHPHVWRPPTDVFDVEQAIIVRVEIAGVRESDFEIGIEGQYLFIHGVRQDSGERRAYHQLEIPFGEFRVDVELPVPVENGLIQVVYRDGFLRVTLPKAQPKHIHIKDE